MSTQDHHRLIETRAFFGPRAAGWEDRFAGDDPRFEEAVAALAPPKRGVAIDVGCGTGRALGVLRAAVGAEGLVLGLDATPEMLSQAKARGRHHLSQLLLGDAFRLPIAGGTVDAVLAAGLIPHLPDPAAGLRELGRVTVPGGRLAVFHPIGRAALRVRHGRPPPGLHEDDPLNPEQLAQLLARTGWGVVSIDDGVERYLALAERVVGPIQMR